MRIFYISYFADKNECPDRMVVLSAQKKISYIKSCLNENCDQLYIISTALPTKDKPKSKKKTIYFSDKEIHVYLPFRWKHFRKVQTQINLLLYLLKNVKSGDLIVFYHSLIYINPLKIFHMIRKNKIVMEFNDWYKLHFTDESSINSTEKIEEKIIRITDAYILASPFMQELIDKSKPWIVNYGNYETVDTNKKGEIKIAYTGVVEKLRKGAYLIAESARYLPNDIKITIAGYGTNECLSDLKILCDKINNSKGHQCIEIIEPLQGKPFDDFLSSIDIALNCHTYSVNELWKSKYSFPSKIPLNMGHGAYVVTYNYEIITKSPFLPCCVLFDEFTPLSLSKAIIKCIDIIKSDTKKTRRTLFLI